MAHTDLHRLRLLIQDLPREEQQVQTGDGRSAVFLLPHTNIADLEVSLLGSDIQVLSQIVHGSFVPPLGGFEGQSSTVSAGSYKTFDSLEFVFDPAASGEIRGANIFAVVPVSTLDMIADGDLASVTVMLGAIGRLVITGVSASDQITFEVHDTELSTNADRLNVLGLRNQAVDPGNPAWVDADPDSVDALTGKVVLENIVSGQVRFLYSHTVFSDDDLEDYIEQGELRYGDKLYGAALLVVDTLMFDGVKRNQWRAPDGTMVNDTAAQAHLQQMRDRFKQELAENAIAGGAIVDWSGMQQDAYG